MMLQTTIVVEPSAAQQNTLELLLQDRGRVETEFAAIMNAAGFGDRLIVATFPCPPHPDRVRWISNARRDVAAKVRMRTREARSRVRSPPGR